MQLALGDDELFRLPGGEAVGVEAEREPFAQVVHRSESPAPSLQIWVGDAHLAVWQQLEPVRLAQRPLLDRGDGVAGVRRLGTGGNTDQK